MKRESKVSMQILYNYLKLQDNTAELFICVFDTIYILRYDMIQ